MLPRFGSKTRCRSKTRTPPLISRLRRQLPPKGKPWAVANPSTQHAPLPPPLGEVSERSEGRRGSATTIPTLSVSFADSSPKGRAKGFLQTWQNSTHPCLPLGEGGAKRRMRVGEAIGTSANRRCLKITLARTSRRGRTPPLRLDWQCSRNLRFINENRRGNAPPVSTLYY